MEITGKIIAVLPPSSGVSKRTGTAWKSQDFVIETQDQYPRKCCFRVFGEDKINNFNIQPGEVLTVSFDIDSHEYNGRWYNDINAWAVNRNAQQQQQPIVNTIRNSVVPSMDNAPFPPATEAPAASGESSSADDLPF
jgi:hypothetical protein